MVSKTINQLHFEDLDPIRFEELILSIVYRWKRWKTLDHFGKAGSDDGIDIKASYILDNGKNKEYVFQCKRYKKITLTQLKKIAKDFFEKNSSIPDTYVLAIGCPVSKKNIERFRAILTEQGVSQVIIWTSSILESILYNEYQDLLFAFFGISLVERRNNKATRIRRNIALKKRMQKDFVNHHPTNTIEERLKDPSSRFEHSEILIRSISDKAYPENTLLEEDYTGYFKVEAYDFYHNGIIVIHGVEKIRVKYRDGDEEGKNAFKLGYIPYDNIIEYDIDGDEFYNYPHLFCDFVNVHDPFEKIGYAITTDEGSTIIE
jgi:hypothetical protein